MKLRLRHLALILFVEPAMGCGRQYAGSSSGGSAIPGQFLQHCYVLQRDVRPTHGAAKPLFLILWKARMAGSCSTDNRNRLTSIHGEAVHVRFDTTAVYALQSDYTLRQIGLTGPEIEHVLRLVEQRKTPFSEDGIWRAKVEPVLKEVEERARSAP